jgi:hypothetical protein
MSGTSAKSPKRRLRRVVSMSDVLQVLHPFNVPVREQM